MNQIAAWWLIQMQVMPSWVMFVMPIVGVLQFGLNALALVKYAYLAGTVVQRVEHVSERVGRLERLSDDSRMVKAAASGR